MYKLLKRNALQYLSQIIHARHKLYINTSYQLIAKRLGGLEKQAAATQGQQQKIVWLAHQNKTVRQLQ